MGRLFVQYLAIYNNDNVSKKVQWQFLDVAQSGHTYKSER